jgi:hypothetical protein
MSRPSLVQPKVRLLAALVIGAAAMDVRAHTVEPPKLVAHSHGPRRFLAPEGADISFDQESDRMQAYWSIGEDNADWHDQYLVIAVREGRGPRDEIRDNLAGATQFAVEGWRCASGRDNYSRTSARCGRRLDRDHMLIVSVDGDGLTPRGTEILVERVARALRGYGREPEKKTSGAIKLPRLTTFAQHGVSFLAPQGWYVSVDDSGDLAAGADRPHLPNAWMFITVRQQQFITKAELSDVTQQNGWLCGTASRETWMCEKSLDATRNLNVTVGGSLRAADGRALAQAIAVSLSGFRGPILRD